MISIRSYLYLNQSGNHLMQDLVVKGPIPMSLARNHNIIAVTIYLSKLLTTRIIIFSRSRTHFFVF